MLTVTETIYPRLRPRPSQAELKLLFTPTPEDILWVETTCQNESVSFRGVEGEG